MPWARSFCPFRACGEKLAKIQCILLHASVCSRIQIGFCQRVKTSRKIDGYDSVRRYGPLGVPADLQSASSENAASRSWRYEKPTAAEYNKKRSAVMPRPFGGFCVVYKDFSHLLFFLQDVANTLSYVTYPIFIINLSCWYPNFIVPLQLNL